MQWFTRIWATNLDSKCSKTECSHMITLATVNNDIIIKYQQKEQSSMLQKVPLINIMFASYFILTEIYIRKTSCRSRIICDLTWRHMKKKSDSPTGRMPSLKAIHVGFIAPCKEKCLGYWWMMGTIHKNEW